MISLRLPRQLRVLAVGAHADDIEIGAGGTLLRLDEESELVARVVVMTASPERATEARSSAQGFLPGSDLEIQTHSLPDGRLPARWEAVKSIVHELARDFEPDVVLSPSPWDAHQDHRTIAEIIPTEFRDHLILQYEIPKWDGDFGRAKPTHYVPLQDRHIARKCALLAESFPSQSGRDWFQADTFKGLARLRGMECRAPYAEAYAVPKAVLAFEGMG